MNHEISARRLERETDQTYKQHAGMNVDEEVSVNARSAELDKDEIRGDESCSQGTSQRSNAFCRSTVSANPHER